MNYWLMKSEPAAFSISDLKNSSCQTTSWDGVRNYQARNFMKQMAVGDRVFFYHSNCKIPGIIGIAEVCKKAYPDLTALDPLDEHYDPKSTPENPRWEMVDIQLIQEFKSVIPLHSLYQYETLKEMPLLRKGNRLSVMPVKPYEWEFILSLAAT
jgi:predicted RNA-binding protein with PUA-like domain